MNLRPDFSRQQQQQFPLFRKERSGEPAVAGPLNLPFSKGEAIGNTAAGCRELSS